MPKVRIHTTYSNGCKPLDFTDSHSEARDALARWVRECRRDLNIILFREGKGRFFATTVNGVWEGTRKLVG